MSGSEATSAERGPGGPPVIPQAPVTTGWRPGKLLLLSLAGGGLLLAGVLYAFDPASSGFYPPCIFSRLTGFLCPGCGGLRATHQLLHGNVAQAFSLNPLVVLVFPVLGLAVAGSILRPASRWPIFCLYATLAVSLVFGVIRNLR